MSKRIGNHLISILFFIALIGVSLAAGDAAAQSSAAIHLQSRTFTPQPGIDPDLLALESLPPRWHGLIQLDGAPGTAVRQSLQTAGVELLAYVPDHTWLASLPANLAAVEATPGVRWLGRYRPEDRLAPELANGQADAWARNADGSLNLVVDLFADVSLIDGEAQIGALGGTVTAVDPTARQIHLTLPDGALDALTAVDAIQWISPAAPPKSSNNFEARLLVASDTVEAAPYNLSGQGVIAAMWDDGLVDATHPDFAGRLTAVGGAAAKNHATHVGGTMGGDGTNSVNHGASTPNRWQGVAPAIGLISYDWSNTVNAHDEAINTYNADLSQNSWGYSYCSLIGAYNYNAPQYDEIVGGMFGRSIPVVFAAGNLQATCGDPYGTVLGGAQSAKNVITVGAVNAYGAPATSFSSWGPTQDGRLKPEVVAPGAKPGGGLWSTLVGGGYGGYVGTSQAAPVVSGGLGLMLERYHDICPGSGDAAGNPLPSTLRAVLVHSAVDLTAGEGPGMQPGPDYATGYGRLDVHQAVDILPDHLEGALDHGGTFTQTIFVAQQAELKVTLGWDDVAGTAAAAIALVNDLNLELVDPNGIVHYPWLLDPANPAAPATTGVDALNVIEQVAVANPTPGLWTIRVRGSNVPQGPQSFTLVSDLLTTSSCQGPSAEVWLDDGTTPGQGPELQPWDSQDIWNRHELDDALLYEHQNQDPEHGETNYLYIKVRNAGTNSAHTVKVFAYWADQSAGPALWPNAWQLIGSDTVINVAPGGADVAVLAWDPPAPASPINGQQFSLYVRLVSMQDTIVETGDAATNIINNDNIAGKNVLVLDINPNPGQIPTAVLLSGVYTISPELQPSYLAGAGLLGLLTLLALHRRRRIRPAPQTFH